MYFLPSFMATVLPDCENTGEMTVGVKISILVVHPLHTV